MPLCVACTPVRSCGDQPRVNTPVANLMANAMPPVSSPGNCALGRVIVSGFGSGATKFGGALTFGPAPIGAMARALHSTTASIAARIAARILEYMVSADGGGQTVFCNPKEVYRGASA